MSVTRLCCVSYQGVYTIVNHSLNMLFFSFCDIYKSMKVSCTEILSEKFPVVVVNVTIFSSSELCQLPPKTCSQQQSIYLRLKTMVFV